MKLDWKDRRTQLGGALIVLGTLSLAGNWGLWAGLSSVVRLLVFVLLGGVIVARSWRVPERIWPLPVGFGLVGLGLASVPGPWFAGVFLASIGFGFLAVWATDPQQQRWWALLPAGVLLTLGTVESYEAWFGIHEAVSGTILFLGLAATFVALYALPSVRQRWAIWPAAGLAVVALMNVSATGSWWLPVALILAGVVLFVRPFQR